MTDKSATFVNHSTANSGRFLTELRNLVSSNRIERVEVRFWMARRSAKWKYWTGLSFLGSLSVTLAVGWWLSHRAQSVEVETLRSQIEDVPSQDSITDLRSENDDLIHFIDEAYTLLREEGIHIQLDLDVDQDGHYRLRADSAELTAELKAKLRELNEKRNEASRKN